jgi:hypothetical protein
MTFVFPLLLGGLACASIPVLLHLIVRQKPQTLPFPALRFLVQKQKTNLRKLRLRHLLLLTLRMVLIAALCLALAQPRLFYDRLDLGSERPIAAVLIFDTSASMEYKHGDTTRLEVAKQRGLELLEQLPEGCRLLVFDTADVLHERAAAPWLKSLDEARKRIAGLKVRPANAPVTRSLEKALRRCDELARTGDDPEGQRLVRFVCVFTDRTRGCWESDGAEPLQEVADRVPPLFEGLQQTRTALGPLAEMLRELRDKLPPAGKEFSDQALLEAVRTLQEEVRQVTPLDMPPGDKLGGAVRQVRRLGRELLRQTEPSVAAKEEASKDASQEYRLKLRASLHEVLGDLAGAQVLFVDVGVEQPVDLALLGLELPRDQRGQMQQSFAAGEKWVLQALVQATGKEVDNTLLCQVDGKKLPPRSFKLAAGQKELVPLFDSATLADLKEAPFHQVEARFETSADALPLNNQAYLTFVIRARQRILLLADEVKRAELPARALEALGYEAVVQPVRGKEVPSLAGFEAVYLVSVAEPGASLWQSLANFVHNGGGLAVIPPGDELVAGTYNEGPAAQLLPGKFQGKVSVPEPGSPWQWQGERGQYQHPFLQAFGLWKDDPKTDFILYPRGATQYWEVKPYNPRSVLMRYQDEKKLPALLERAEPGQGKVLQFTTPLDPRQPAWNNYDAKITSFYLALMWQSSRYLCGEQATPTLNFRLGLEEPAVALVGLTPGKRYALTGAEIFDKLSPPENGVLTFKEVSVPGNFTLQDREAKKAVAGFSVNLPAEESDLSRVPEAELEQFAGPGSIIAAGRHVELRKALGERWNEPIDVFPWLMVLLLFVLALENLLANKFYGQSDVAQAAGKPAGS